MTDIVCTSSIDAVTKDRLDLKILQKQMYEWLGADEKDLFFFYASQEEAISQLIFSFYFERSLKEGKNHFIASEMESAPILLALKRLEDAGCFVSLVPVDERGQLKKEELKKAISPKTALVCLSWAHPLTGVIQDIETIASICKNVPLFLDASDSLGKIPFCFEDLKVDFLTVAGDQIHSLGGAVLLIKQDQEFIPLYQKYASNVRMLASFVAALRQSSLYLDQMLMETSSLRDLFEKKMKQLEGTSIIFENELRLPNVSCVIFENIWHEALHYHLNRKNVSFGEKNHQSLSRILDYAHQKHSNCALSFSFSRYTTEKEIHEICDQIASSHQILKKVSQDL